MLGEIHRSLVLHRIVVIGHEPTHSATNIMSRVMRTVTALGLEDGEC